jgi:hypothetical protein
MVEDSMRMTLAQLLAQAVQEIEQFKSLSVDATKYMEWIDSFQAQLVVLAAQISWSESVESALQVSCSTLQYISQICVIKYNTGYVNLIEKYVLNLNCLFCYKMYFHVKHCCFSLFKYCL